MSLNTPDNAPPPPLPELVEVVDLRDRPLAVVPLAEAHRQVLLHRAVLVLVYNREGKVFLQRRSNAKQLFPGRWDLSATGHVQAGESREEAAIRELEEELGVRVERLALREEVPAGVETGFEFITLFSAGRILAEPSPNPEEVDGGLFVDSHELAYLVEHYRDMLTPGLVYFWEKGLIFPAGRTP